MVKRAPSMATGNGTVSVIDTATNKVTATVNVGSYLYGIAITPDGRKVYVSKEYVSNDGNNTVSVIDTSTNSVTATVPVGSYPYGVAVNPAGTKVYVVNSVSNTVSVIDTSTDSVTATVPVGGSPQALGDFIGEKTVEQTQSPKTSKKGSMKTPGFETIYGVVILLAVFLHKTHMSKHLTEI